MPPAYSSTLSSDVWHGNVDRPFNSGTQVRVYTHNQGNAFSLDELIDSGATKDLGDTISSEAGGLPVVRGWVTNVELEHINDSAVRETVTWSDELQYSSGWGSTSTQSSVPTAPGYVNCDIRDIQTSATWWKLADPSFWGTPWETATPSASDQDTLQANTTKVVDLAGVPMTAPLPQEELIIQTTWETATAATVYRARWRAMRHKRNNAAFLGYGTGTLLFCGASTRVGTQGDMPISDLRFVYDPYGHLRQRAISDANGQYTEEFLREVDSPVTDSTDFDPHKHAKYVYWVQLHQSLGDFSTLLTTSQANKASALIT